MHDFLSPTFHFYLKLLLDGAMRCSKYSQGWERERRGKDYRQNFGQTMQPVSFFSLRKWTQYSTKKKTHVDLPFQAPFKHNKHKTASHFRFVLWRTWGNKISYGQTLVKSLLMCPAFMSATYRQCDDKTQQFGMGAVQCQWYGVWKCLTTCCVSF